MIWSVVMLHSHVHGHGPLPQLGQHVAQDVHAGLAHSFLHVLLDIRLLLIPELDLLGTVGLLGEDEPVLWRAWRSDGHGGGEVPDVAGWRRGHGSLLVESLVLPHLGLVYELLLLVIVDVLEVVVHGELPTGRLPRLWLAWISGSKLE